MPEKLILIFLAPNVRSRYQTMDMGIIACFNVGYRVGLIKYLIWLFYVEEGYGALEVRSKISKTVLKGLCVSRNTIMLDLVDLRVGILNGVAKYAYKNTM